MKNDFFGISRISMFLFFDMHAAFVGVNTPMTVTFTIDNIQHKAI